ncbi:double-strand break repair helicase AddA [Parablastomonas sp. CN1-191]|uniref:double-strand break repair helicase AddA n=1 Tax=Parablastomonas sp. CN1-191 TaxID=3400908 RepID=UPI003BF77A51
MSVPRLQGSQLAAVSPQDTVWLSASAGTGKTQVLSSRVLRLLLQPEVAPSQILCLTFTKAGATEMAARINATLAEWVRLPDVQLHERLEAIGAPSGPEARSRARTLFAAVLDCPGGGLRIDTIHAFAQWLLAAFPEEAGLTPGTRAMEDRDRALLAREVLATLAVGAEDAGDRAVGDALAMLSLRMGPGEVEAFLLRCAAARELWFGPGAWVPPLRPRVNRLLGLEADADLTGLADLCGEPGFDCAALDECLRVYRQWSAATGQKVSAAIAAWLAGHHALRLDQLDELAGHLFTKEGAPKNIKSLEKIDPDYEAAAMRVATSIAAVRERRTLLTLAAWLAPSLELGRRFALAWDEAKAREGLIDFDDQIRSAAALLSDVAMSDWIRYKLDRRFDHILVDEAQDTNAAQWRIIDALTGDFFAGAGQHDGKLRTLFVVGDYKQAIFRFQGTSPENFEAARSRVQRQMRAAVEGARGTDVEARDLLEPELARSFRTAQPVLDFVDEAIAAITPAAFGLHRAPEPHRGDERPGLVTLWKPVGSGDRDEPGDEPGGDEPDAGGGLLPRPDREMADRIARQVKDWLEAGFPLAKGTPRLAGPGDIMVLVRKRRELAGLIVARLHAAGVPVAGVDRLRLGAPLAVRDCLAALRFAAQPLDDLTLASLLVSPLVGWTQEQLLEHGYRDRGRLWTHLRQSREPVVAATVAKLGELLARADFDPPHALLHWLLIGPWQGRKALVARLGHEANDPLDELVNAAHAFAAAQTPSLVGFLTWFDAGAGELKREAEGGGGRVRVMTVHGSKGLQAPIVILADAAGNPAAGRGATLDLAEPDVPGVEEALKVPLPGLRREERAGRIAAAEAAATLAEAQEHWRLLYVAMTRAEEALFVGGALGLRETEPAEDSWYARLAALFMPDALREDPLWGWRMEHGHRAPRPPATAKGAAEPIIEVPAWAASVPPAEPRPPRPLAPSALGEDIGADPPHPPGPAAAEAARRGVLLHRLFERLPDIAAEARRNAALRWLARNAADLDVAAHEAMAASACEVLGNPDWAALFGPGSFAEVPLAATVGGQVIAGTVDRLVVSPERVRIVDYKTARRVPADAGAVPGAILRQMGAYAAALAAIYPDRRIEAALLYTAAPRLIEIDAAALAAHKPGLA